MNSIYLNITDMDVYHYIFLRRVYYADFSFAWCIRLMARWNLECLTARSCIKFLQILFDY